MKNVINVIIMAAEVAIGFIIWWFVMGNPANFKDGVMRHEPLPGNVLGTIHTGGPLVALLLAFIMIAITFVIERTLSLNKAQGKEPMPIFIKKIQTLLEDNDIAGALAACDAQRGSLANILRAGLEKYLAVKDSDRLDPEKKMLEVKRAIDEQTNLETPLLEKNLVILSTIASIATMVGLLGTTLGMIRAFAALGAGGTVSAQALSIGISEALYNTAGGLIGAVICIVFFNMFTTRVDNFTYLIDEAILSVTEILTVKVKQ
ncbi:MAG: MotA/TolQ/ExbB proton channel family protein [Bacteroidota bacterium]|nr:MotA/TolQ/ExbB proton channel family protein [Candidatus Kapabacteria bacterium]MDW8220670.1 MotA/TolQ/ExbB proton channel family protein [Bacteroidota bacterium]